MVVAVIPVVTQAQELGSKPTMGFSVWEMAGAGECRDRITFLGDKEFLLESDEQISTKAYKLRRYGRTGFYIFSLKTTSHNKLANCEGNQGFGVGEKHGTYIKFSESADEMIFYSQPEDDARANLSFKKR